MQKVCWHYYCSTYLLIPAFWSLGWLRWHMANAAKVNSSFPSGTFLKTLTPFFKALPWLLHEKPLISLMYQSVDTNTMMRNPISAFCQEASWIPRSLRGTWAFCPSTVCLAKLCTLLMYWHLDRVIITKLVTFILLREIYTITS